MSVEYGLPHAERESWRSSVLPVVLTLLSALPVLIIPYLPMTDLPQHFANLSILTHMDDPSYGFSRIYEYDFSKSLYIMPYLIGWGFTHFMPTEIALRCVVFSP